MAGNSIEVTGPGGVGAKGSGTNAILALILAGVLIGVGFGVWKLAEANSHEHRELRQALELNTCVLTLTVDERVEVRKWAKTGKDFKYYCPWLRESQK